VAAAARVEGAAVQLATQLQGALGFVQQRVDRLRAAPVVRAAVEIDNAAVRDVWRHEPLARVVAGETFELSRPSRPPLRVPASAPSLPRLVPGHPQLDAVAEGLRVSLGATVEPLFPRGKLSGMVVVSQVVPLESVTALGDLGASLDDTPPTGAFISAMVRCPSLPTLTLTAHQVDGGGGLIWTGRVLLLIALVLVLTALVSLMRARPEPQHQPRPEPQHQPRPEPQHQPPSEPQDPPRNESIPIDVQPFVSIALTHTSDEPTTQMLRRADGTPLPPPRERRDTLRAAPHSLAVAASLPSLAWNEATPMPQLMPDRADSVSMNIDPRAELLSGRYRLIKHLGRGTHADVYLAQALAAGGEGFVSLKLLSPQLPPLEREAHLLAARRLLGVTHPNLARVLDIDEAAPPFIASEYIEGCTLEELARGLGAELPAGQCVAIAVAVCQGLEAAPLQHGAVKPRNVLVGRHNAIKLTDFGAPPAPSDRLAPEQYAGKRTDARTDVYAVGVLLHELLTGERVYPANAGEMRWPALAPPSMRRPEVGPELDAVIARATAFGPRSRHPDAATLRQDLERAAAHLERNATLLGEFVERARRSI
jgi:hypothetical protein